MDIQTLVLAVVAGSIVATVLLLIVRRASREGVTPLVTGGLDRSATTLGQALRQAWSSGLDDSTWSEMTEALVAADVGPEASEEIVQAVRKARPASADEARERLADQLRSQLGGRERDLSFAGRPTVVLVVGVNGTGKTTTIAKLANRFVIDGRSVLLAAADTFRAAAAEQLRAWGARVGVEVIAGQEGSDPGSVVFDAVAAARARGYDVVIIDTAGRLHAKKNLMAELSKIHRVAAGDRGNVDEVLLVLDATGGQNGLAQVRDFSEAVPVTGIILTKLDGTAKGGIVVAIERYLGVPVKFVGLGEGLGDLEPFDPDRFVGNLLEHA